MASSALAREPEPAMLAPDGVSFLGVGAGGWAGATALYALIGVAAALGSWTAVPPPPWPESIPAFRVVFEAPTEPSAPPAPASPPTSDPAREASAPAAPVEPPSPVAEEPPLPSAPVATLPPPPPRKPVLQPRPAPSPPAPPQMAMVVPSETQVAAATTIMPAPPSLPAATGPYVPPHPINAADPIYPAIARAHGWQGRVLLRLEVSADGAVRDATVVSSSGYPVLDDAALAKARSWHFAPATREGAAVAASVDQPVRFRLEE